MWWQEWVNMVTGAAYLESEQALTHIRRVRIFIVLDR